MRNYEKKNGGKELKERKKEKNLGLISYAPLKRNFYFLHCFQLINIIINTIHIMLYLYINSNTNSLETFVWYKEGK